MKTLRIHVQVKINTRTRLVLYSSMQQIELVVISKKKKNMLAIRSEAVASLLFIS